MQMVGHDTVTEQSYLFWIPPEFHFGHDDFGYFIIPKIRHFIGSAYGYEIDMTVARVVEIFKMYPFSAANLVIHGSPHFIRFIMVRSGTEPYTFGCNARSMIRPAIRGVRSGNEPYRFGCNARSMTRPAICRARSPNGPCSPETRCSPAHASTVRLGNGPYIPIWIYLMSKKMNLIIIISVFLIFWPIRS